VQLPALSARAADDLGGAEATSRRLARAATLVIVPVAVTVAAGLQTLTGMVFGSEFRHADTAMAFGLALLPLAPVAALASQATVLRLRPGVRVRAAVLGFVVFLATAVAAVPGGGAAGAMAALLAGTLTTVLLMAYLLRDAIGPRLLATAIVGSGLTLAIGLVAW
jgi:O-antigen/teichoic acid export membrane protein